MPRYCTTQNLAQIAPSCHYRRLVKLMTADDSLRRADALADWAHATRVAFARTCAALVQDTASRSVAACPAIRDSGCRSSQLPLRNRRNRWARLAAGVWEGTAGSTAGARPRLRTNRRLCDRWTSATQQPTLPACFKCIELRRRQLKLRSHP